MFSVFDPEETSLGLVKNGFKVICLLDSLHDVMEETVILEQSVIALATILFPTMHYT